MRIVYGAPNGGGWHPVTYMVHLLAELLAAELVTVPIARPVNVARRLAAAGPRRRGREVCLIVAAAPRHLNVLLQPAYWLRGYGHVAGWVIDSFWVEQIPFVARRRDHFDQLFVTDTEVVEIWSAATGLPVSWLPWGADVLRLGSANPDREIDLLRFGRQPPGWENDAEIQRMCEEAGIRFQGRPPIHEDAHLNQRELMNRIARAKFTLAFSNAVNPASYTHPTREYLTGRWTDSLAAGAVVAGVTPACGAAEALLWPGATVDLETVDPAAGIARIAEDVARWTPRTAYSNHREALRRLDWRWRFEQLAGSLGVRSDQLEAELDAIRAAAGPS